MKNQKALLLKILIPAAIIIAAVIIAIVFCGKDEAVNDTNIEFITDSPVVTAQHHEDFTGWFYGFEIKYTGSTEFTITDSYEIFKSSNTNEEVTMLYDDAMIDNMYGSHVLAPCSSSFWSGGMPLQDVSSVTLVIEGTDGHGKAHEFRGTIELSQEITSVNSGDAAPASEGGTVTITPKENPVEPVEFEEFINGIGWFYELAITNNGTSGVTINSIQGIIIDSVTGEEHLDQYSDEVLTNVFGGNVLYAGQTAYFNGGMPVQDISSLVLIVNYTDAYGCEYESRGCVEFTK